MARSCAQIEADLTTFRSRLDAILLGNSIEEGGYGGHRVKYTAANVPELRRRIAELEDEARACNCSGLLTTPRGHIRPVQ